MHIPNRWIYRQLSNGLFLQDIDMVTVITMVSRDFHFGKILCSGDPNFFKHASRYTIEAFARAVGNVSATERIQEY